MSTTPGTVDSLPATQARKAAFNGAPRSLRSRCARSSLLGRSIARTLCAGNEQTASTGPSIGGTTVIEPSGAGGRPAAASTRMR